MTDNTFTRRCNKLLQDISASDHKDELLDIMSQQILDDTPVIQQELIPIRSY